MIDPTTFRVYGENKEYPRNDIESKMAKLYLSGHSVTMPFINPWNTREWNIAYDENKELGHCEMATEINTEINSGNNVGHLIVLSDNNGNITEEKAYCLVCERDFSELIEF